MQVNSMKKDNHSLTNREMDADGMVDKYEEFTNSDFSNEFEPLEKPDYEIRASQNNNCKEECMKDTRKASYIGELSSGYDATVQDDYDAGKGDKGQIGKGHEEEVAAKNNWDADKRDAVGRAASAKLLRKMAIKLNKVADIMEDEEEDFDDVDDVDDEVAELENVEGDVDDEELEDVVASVVSESKKTAVKKEAVHPEEHDVKKDDPEADMSSQTGDEEWIDIGPGEFDDKRDEVGRAAEGK